MTLVRPAPPEHYPWIAERAHLVINQDLRAMEVVDDAGRILGMVGIDGWTKSACQVHIALEHPTALRHLLRPAFGLLFDSLKRTVVNAIVLSTNARSLVLVKHLGFRETHRIIDGWDNGVDLVMFEMRRGDCRWVSQQPLRKAG